MVRPAPHHQLGGPAGGDAQQVRQELRLRLRHPRGHRPLDSRHHGEAPPRSDTVKRRKSKYSSLCSDAIKFIYGENRLAQRK